MMALTYAGRTFEEFQYSFLIQEEKKSQRNTNVQKLTSHEKICMPTTNIAINVRNITVMPAITGSV